MTYARPAYCAEPVPPEETPPAFAAGPGSAWQPLHQALRSRGQGDALAAGAAPGTLVPAADAASALAAREEALARRAGELDAALAELAELRRRVLADSEAQVVALALQVAAEVLQRDVPARAEYTSRMVHLALEALAEADAITLRCAPADLARLRARQPQLFTRPGVTFEAAPELGGGVRARCALGTLDASVRGRLHELAVALMPDAPPAVTLADGDGASADAGAGADADAGAPSPHGGAP